MTHTVQRATLIGMVAILLWSTSVGVLRSVAENFGPVGGAALVYTLSALFLCLVTGLPRLRGLPRRYLIVGGGLFVVYEISFALAIGFAHNRSQAIELGMINYLWPSLTVLLARFINHQRSSVLLWPGLLLACLGVVQVLKGDGDWSPQLLWNNVQDNPVAYGMAFSAAITWALYCTLTRRLSEGKSGVTLFFAATALVMWLKFMLTSEPPMNVTLTSTLQLLFMGISTAIAYTLWNQGIQFGNMTMLATASYFTPVLSALLASLWLGVRPGVSFWLGVALVVCGSLLCWLATRRYSG